MKVQGHIKIGNKQLQPGSRIPWLVVYPFFMVHMLAFGFSGFAMSYAENGPPPLFVLVHGGFAIVVYLIFYIGIFGREEVKWMWINGALGFFGIWSQIDWILARCGKNISAYPPWAHITPFMYYILYTFLLRQALLDLFRVRESESRTRVVNALYVTGSLAFYLWMYFRHAG